MSAELEIPHASFPPLLAIEDDWESDAEVEAAIRAIATPVVVSELLRLAFVLERRSDNVPLGRGSHESGAVNRVGDLREVADLLRARVDELDAS